VSVGSTKGATDVLRRLKNEVRSSLFRGMEKYFGVHVTPVHYYSPIPKVSELSPDIYTRVGECPGLDFQEPAQFRFLDDVLPPLMAEYTPAANSGLSQVDSVVLYAMIRSRKPSLVVEIGSGESTRISLAALQRNAASGSNGRLVAVEPYPRSFLKAMVGPQLQLIESRVENVALDVFRDADLLFIDSSHVARIGSDVNFEMFEIVPRMKVGALVHWHDIMIPVDYSREWIQSGTKFWNESYVVHAFMLNNKCFRVVWASRYMQVKHADRLRAQFPYFNPQDPEQQLSSFWVERIA
jgi:hypothetical protein